MKQAKISQVKNSLSHYLRYVQKGGKVRIFDRDTPVADLIPVQRAIQETQKDLEISLSSLEAKGIIKRGTGQLPPELLIPPEGPVGNVLDALLSEREEGR